MFPHRGSLIADSRAAVLQLEVVPVLPRGSVKTLLTPSLSFVPVLVRTLIVIMTLYKFVAYSGNIDLLSDDFSFPKSYSIEWWDDTL